MPTLAVIIPNYNHGSQLRELLHSLLSQSRLPDEIVVVDDGSRDNSVAIIEELSRKNPIIKLYKNERNQGVVYTLNRALEMTNCDYVTFPSADNMVLQGMYESAMSILSQYPQAGLCCSDPLYFEEKTGQMQKQELKLSTMPIYFSPLDVVSLSRKEGFCPGNMCHTVVVKRQALKEAGRDKNCYLPDLKWHCDFFAINVIAFRHGVCYVPEGFGVFRVVEDSYCRKIHPWKIRKEVYRKIVEYLDHPYYSDVKPLFQKSAILSHFTYSVLSVLIHRPAWYGYLNPVFIKRVWPATIRVIMVSIPLARKTYRLIKKMRQVLAKGRSK